MLSISPSRDLIKTAAAAVSRVKHSTQENTVLLFR